MQKVMRFYVESMDKDMTIKGMQEHLLEDGVIPVEYKHFVKGKGKKMTKREAYGHYLTDLIDDNFNSCRNERNYA